MSNKHVHTSLNIHSPTKFLCSSPTTVSVNSKSLVVQAKTLVTSDSTLSLHTDLQADLSGLTSKLSNGFPSHLVKAKDALTCFFVFNPPIFSETIYFPPQHPW